MPCKKRISLIINIIKSFSCEDEDASIDIEALAQDINLEDFRDVKYTQKVDKEYGNIIQ
jgi:hypothetical protein